MKYVALFFLIAWVVRVIARVLEAPAPTRVSRATRSRAVPAGPIVDTTAVGAEARCPWCGVRIRRKSWDTSVIVKCRPCGQRYEVDQAGQARRLLTTTEKPLSSNRKPGRNGEITTDPYSTLGVAADADARTLKKAYFRLIRRHTPEDDPEVFRRVSEAYRLLSDPGKREEYDRSEHLPEEVQHRIEAVLETATEDPEGAYEPTEKLLEDHGDSEAVRAVAGMVLLRSGRPARAFQVVSQLANAHPDDIAHAKSLAVCLFESGRQERALTHIRKALERDPEASETYLTLADFHARREEVEEALAVLDRGIQADGQVDLLDLPLFMRKILLLGNLRDFPRMHETAKTLFDAMPDGDTDARAYVSHAFRSLAAAYDEAGLPHLTKFAVDFALRATSDDAELRQLSVDLREPSRRFLEGERVFADDRVPDWIKMMIVPYFHQEEGFDAGDHLANLQLFVTRVGLHQCQSEWRRFRGAYPVVADQASGVWLAILRSLR